MAMRKVYLLSPVTVTGKNIYLLSADNNLPIYPTGFAWLDADKTGGASVIFRGGGAGGRQYAYGVGCQN